MYVEGYILIRNMQEIEKEIGDTSTGLYRRINNVINAMTVI